MVKIGWDEKRWPEWVEYFEGLGLEEEKAKKLADKVKLKQYDVILLEKGDIFSVGKGAGEFYYEWYKEWIPDDEWLLEVVEIYDKRGYVEEDKEGEVYLLKPKDETFVVSYSVYEYIDGVKEWKEKVVYVFDADNMGGE